MTDSLFSIVVALYGVEDYVETFLESLERQTFGVHNLDIVIVDDGSLDGSYGVVKRWALKYPQNIRHTTKPNGGAASARNVGLSMARNKWVTFADPDDAFHPRYFEYIHDFISRDQNNKAVMLAGRQLIWEDESRRLTDTHALGRKFRFSDRLVNLNVEPNNIQLTGVTAFLLRDHLMSNNLRFDTRVVPTFEDAHLLGRYLGLFDKPIIGLVSRARYLYRKRVTGGSLVQTSWTKSERFDDVVRFGYIGLLEYYVKSKGYVPVWVQNMVIYDLQWYFSEDRKMHSATGRLVGDAAEKFHILLRSTFKYIDRDVIDTYNTTNLAWATRQAMLSRFKGDGFVPNWVARWSKPGELPVKVVYPYTGDLPDEYVEIDGRPVELVAAKSVSHMYFGKEFFVERQLFLPRDGAIRVWLNGEVMPFRPLRRATWSRPLPPIDPLVLAPSEILEVEGYIARLVAKIENRLALERLMSGGTFVEAAWRIFKRVTKRKLGSIRRRYNAALDARTRNWASSPIVREKYKDAWVVMDRVGHADDNGEHLYRHLIRDRPDINAWFLLDAASPDWGRLEEEGFRLVPYGSREAVGLSLNAAFQISSDATYEVQYPVGTTRFGKPSAKIVFLQHGVTMHDLSRWLNPKNISLIISATEPEYRSIAGDRTSYRYGTHEVKLTGFPRYDALRRKADGVSLDDKKYILIMPSWRQSLVDALQRAPSEQSKADALLQSVYGRNWTQFLQGEALRDLASQNDLDVVFVPHPALASYVNMLNLPDYVLLRKDIDQSLQDIFVHAKLAITDYSSVAFDWAFLGIPVVYFQFDSETLYDGSHNYRRGYYDYNRDGFGPVCGTGTDLEREITRIGRAGFVRSEVYEDRSRETFSHTDAGNSKRVVEEISNLLDNPVNLE